MLSYKGLNSNVTEVKNYFIYITNLDKKLVTAFFNHVENKLSREQTTELQHLYLNYKNAVTQFPSISKDFLVNVLGMFHLSNSLNLMYVLESMEVENDDYLNFKEQQQRIEKLKLNNELEVKWVTARNWDTGNTTVLLSADEINN